jgi:hypothetical protein
MQLIQLLKKINDSQRHKLIYRFPIIYRHDNRSFIFLLDFILRLIFFRDCLSFLGAAHQIKIKKSITALKKLLLK